MSGFYVELNESGNEQTVFTHESGCGDFPECHAEPPACDHGLTVAQRLIKNADAAYEREDQGWFYAQPLDTLTFLWGIACASVSGASWDDEVYDALAARNWFD